MGLRQGVVMSNGLVVCPCLTYKSSSTTFKRLLLLILTNKVVQNPHYWYATLKKHHIETRPCTNTSFNFSVVRNPYDRVVSFYNDKYVRGKLLPPHMPKGLTIEQFVERLVHTHLPTRWQVAAAHYAPITTQWACTSTSEIFKIEDVGEWKEAVFKRLNVTPEHIRRIGLQFVTQSLVPKYKANLTQKMIHEIEHFARSDFDLFHYSRLSDGLRVRAINMSAARERIRRVDGTVKPRV